MLDGIILGTVGWIVTDANFHPQPIGQALQILFEDVVAGTVATASITKHQQLGRVGVVASTLRVKPQLDTFTGELGGIFATI